jgi:transcriptional regulator GlxA family with amidase domain
MARGSVRLVAPAGPLRVCLVVFPDVQVLDVTGPLEVFALANRFAPTPRYAVSVVAAIAGPVATSSGLALVAQRSLAEARGPIDTLLVAGGVGTRRAARDARLVGWLRRAAPRARRVASVCTGAFLLGEAGLLDGRRVTTHWAMCEALQQRFPRTRVERDPIFVRDGALYTSAGITAGIDLALELVEADCGREVALTVARWLVMFLRRPGGQSQFSVQLSGQLAERAGLRELQTWIADHPTADLSVAGLAHRARMSARNFARAFRREVGTTPAAYVEAQRVEAARRLLETTERSLTEVAAGCGFGRVETLHRAFRRALAVSPAQYRRHFRNRRVSAAPVRRPARRAQGA